jgi:hypothetical protein
MRRRVARMALTLALLATTLLGCSDEQVVRGGAPPSPPPTRSPSVPAQPSLVRYVSPTGDNDDPGSVDRPWRTLTFALHRLYNGQVLFIRGGLYHEHVDHLRLHSGTPELPITVLAYPGENPVVVGTVSLLRPAYWLIDNLDVRGDPGAGQQSSFMVKVVGGRKWTWENSEFSGSVGRANVMITGWGIAEPSGFSFTGNCLHGLPRPPQSSTNLFLGSMLPGAHGLVSRNVVFNQDDQANVRIGSGAGSPHRVRLVQNTIFGGSLGIDVRGRPHNLKIRRNIVGGSRAPAMIRFHLGEPHGTRVTSNVAADAAQLLRPEVRKKIVHGFGNVVLSQDPDFVDTTRCDGFRAGADPLIPYGAFAP